MRAYVIIIVSVITLTSLSGCIYMASLTHVISPSVAQHSEIIMGRSYVTYIGLGDATIMSAMEHWVRPSGSFVDRDWIADGHMLTTTVPSGSSDLLVGEKRYYFTAADTGTYTSTMTIVLRSPDGQTETIQNTCYLTIIPNPAFELKITYTVKDDSDPWPYGDGEWYFEIHATTTPEYTGRSPDDPWCWIAEEGKTYTWTLADLYTTTFPFSVKIWVWEEDSWPDNDDFLGDKIFEFTTVPAPKQYWSNSYFDAEIWCVP